MRVAYPTTQFRKDYKKEVKRKGAQIKNLEMVMQKLMNDEMLDKKYYDHKLGGNYKGYRECHIQPDWLLIYRLGIDHNGQKAIYFKRTGSHADLF